MNTSPMIRRRVRPKGVRPGQPIPVRIPVDRLQRLSMAAVGASTEAVLQRWVLERLAHETRHCKDFVPTEVRVTPLGKDGLPTGESQVWHGAKAMTVAFAPSGGFGLDRP